MSELDDLRAELAAEKAKNKKNIVIKVSPKGCVQINGIRRFPLSFYKNEWEIIFGLKERIEEFIVEHDSELAAK
jgi:hypothetical protein